MNNKFLLLIVSSFISIVSFAQSCATYKGSLDEQMEKYPSFYESLEDKNTELQLNYNKILSRFSNAKTQDGVRIIPVVVHVVHDMGNENISDASIQGALDILNANINGQGANFLNNTPDIFAAVRGEAKIEFRLAKIDPLGNPTTGINRVRSSLTDMPEPRDAVKSLSYWNSFQYFNIWTVKRFAPQDDGNTLLGYAQFPNTGSMSTDGVVLLSSQMVSGGTLTHEVGHWLGLRHTWGDSDCGDDGIKDTPQAREPNYGITLANFPYHVGLAPPAPITGPWGCVADSLNPAGEMFVNYMDYSSDAAVTMFTKNQVDVMNITLDGEFDSETGQSGIGFREYMWSEENIIATGTGDGFIVPTCTQEASFVVMNGDPSICEGEALLVKGNQSMFGQGNVSSFVWDFGDGAVDNSGDNFVSHAYNNSGQYDVTLTIEYAETTESRATNLADLDLSSASSYDSIVENLILQGSLQELNDMGATNIELFMDEGGYSLGSYWIRNQLSIDSLTDATFIDTFNVQKIEDQFIVYISDNLAAPDTVYTSDDSSSFFIIDSDNLSAQDLLTLQTPEFAADSSQIYTSDFYVDYLDSIVDYNFYYDTTVINFLTYIDSTYLTADDSTLLLSSDSSWFQDGLLNSTDSIRVYFAQFNMDSVITVSVNTDTTSLSPSDALMYNTADSVWTVNAFQGWVDTVRIYDGAHFYTKYNGYFKDTLFYRGEIEKVTYVAYYENVCTSFLTKEGFVTVSNPNSSSVPIDTYSFETPEELNGDWVLKPSTNVESLWSFNSGDNTSWVWEENVGKIGSSSIKVDKDNMLVGVSTEIVSKSYDLSSFTSPAIKFSWAGAAVNTFPVNELVVTYSDNCGESWKSLGILDPILSANSGIYTTNFKPTTAEWNDTIMTKTQLKNPNIRFKFEYVVNGRSNNFYLDNIMIGEASALIDNNIGINSRLSVSPNPSLGNSIINLHNLSNQFVEVNVVDVLGSKVQQLFSGQAISDYQEIDADLSKLRKGVYFINVISKGNTILTEKVILR